MTLTRHQMSNENNATVRRNNEITRTKIISVGRAKVELSLLVVVVMFSCSGPTVELTEIQRAFKKK